jgi:hypothetical protein
MPPPTALRARVLLVLPLLACGGLAAVQARVLL